MTMPGRRRQAIFFTVLGIVVIVLTVLLNVGWVVLNWRTGQKSNTASIAWWQVTFARKKIRT